MVMIMVMNVLRCERGCSSRCRVGVTTSGLINRLEVIPRHAAKVESIEPTGCVPNRVRTSRQCCTNKLPRGIVPPRLEKRSVSAFVIVAAIDAGDSDGHRRGSKIEAEGVRR